MAALLLLLLVPAALSSGNGESEGENPVSDLQVQFTQDQARRGAAVYAQHCATCHGEELEGFGPFPPLSGSGFREHYQDKTLGELYTFVREQMPLGSGNTLEPTQYADVVTFLLSRNRMPAGEVEFDFENEEMLEAVLSWE